MRLCEKSEIYIHRFCSSLPFSSADWNYILLDNHAELFSAWKSRYSNSTHTQCTLIDYRISVFTVSFSEQCICSRDVTPTDNKRAITGIRLSHDPKDADRRRCYPRLSYGVTVQTKAQSSEVFSHDTIYYIAFWVCVKSCVRWSFILKITFTCSVFIRLIFVFCLLQYDI